ncbi:MAG TPA: diacylglycerol kinase family protein [Rhodanobacteraceae bacterium]
MRLKLIYNPWAGRGRVQRHVPEVQAQLRALGADVVTHASSSPEDLTREAAESSRDVFDRVVICGGDGTLNLALRRFDLSRGTMALVPLGSGDDFARVNGIPRDVKSACEVVVNGVMREVDIACANDMRYAGVAGVGFDSEVARFAQRVKHLQGSAVYLYAILRVLPSFRPLPMRIDGRDEEVMFATFGNTRQYGSGIQIVPDASIDDGLLDSCIVHRTSRWQLLMTLPLAYGGKHTRKPFVEMRRAREFNVETNETMDVFADGEALTKTPARFSIASERLRIVVPR